MHSVRTISLYQAHVCRVHMQPIRSSVNHDHNLCLLLRTFTVFRDNLGVLPNLFVKIVLLGIVLIVQVNDMRALS